MSRTLIRKTFFARLRAFRDDRSGATAIEYSLIAGFVFLAIVAPLQQMGPALTAVVEKVMLGFQ
jgi:Flp pilus assembly pilin Flp